MKHLVTAAVLACAATLPGLARAELIDLGAYNGWNVMVDPELNNGCLIQSARDGKALTRIGYDPAKAEGYIAIFNPDWKRLRKGQSYDLVVALDDQRQPVVATGIQMGTVHGAGVVFTDRKVYDEIAKARTLTVFDASGAAVYQLDLTGTADAIAAARKCQTGDYDQ